MSTPSFHQVAETVARRWTTIHWLRAMRGTILWLAFGLLILVLGMRLAGIRWSDGWAVFAVVIAWVIGTRIWAARRRPNGFAALAAWDESAGRGEMFASAEFFEEHERDHPGEIHHREMSRRKLAEELPKLPEQLPLPRMNWQWAAPLLVLAFAFSPLFKPQLAAVDQKIGDEIAEEARKEAEDLEKELEQMAAAKGLTPEEKAQFEEVVKKAQETASKDMKNAADKTTRELLEELEERARAAEKMAKKLSGDNDKWASDEMIAEMASHADTAELADSIRDKEAKSAAKRARELSKKIDSPELTQETEERINQALAKTMTKATEEDQKKPVGKHVGLASKRMDQKKKDDAAAEFEKLAKEFEQFAQREESQKQMQKLARQLRKAGSKIAGKNMRGMKKMDGNQKMNQNNNRNQIGKMPDIEGLDKLGLSKSQMGAQNLPMLPGIENAKIKIGDPMPGGMEMKDAPIPGSLDGKTITLRPGDGKPGKPPKFAIPIPGAGGAPGAGVGGLEAGQGSAAMGGEETKPMESNQGGIVGAQINADGEVRIRAVEGQARTEAATLKRTQVAKEFLKVQEEALDEADLPASRRDHVQRYFNLLRERFEDE